MVSSGERNGSLLSAERPVLESTPAQRIPDAGVAKDGRQLNLSITVSPINNFMGQMVSTRQWSMLHLLAGFPFVSGKTTNHERVFAVRPIWLQNESPMSFWYSP